MKRKDDLTRYSLSGIVVFIVVEDTLGGANKDLDQSLTRLGIVHTFEVYDGNHTNRVRERFEAKVIPFFSQHLSFSIAK
jgi:hypothetical protein